MIMHPWLLIVLCLQAAPQPAGPQPATPPTPTSGPVYDQGPLKAEISAMQELRRFYMDAPERGASESNFAMQVRLQGERLKNVTQMGNLILSELVDDTGRALIDDQTYTDEDKASLRKITADPERIKQSGLLVFSRAKLPARGAKMLKTIKGSVKLILAEKAEKITILNPLQYMNKTIEDPRLKELGIEIRLVPASEFEQPLPDRCIILQVKSKSENLQGATMYDASMLPMPLRERPPVKTKAGETCLPYCLDTGALSDEVQLVLDVFAQVETVNVPIEGRNVELP